MISEIIGKVGQVLVLAGFSVAMMGFLVWFVGYAIGEMF